MPSVNPANDATDTLTLVVEPDEYAAAVKGKLG
jgi:hypothetical protein